VGNPFYLGVIAADLFGLPEESRKWYFLLN
jgi:hypothetical protein